MAEILKENDPLKRQDLMASRLMLMGLEDTLSYARQYAKSGGQLYAVRDIEEVQIYVARAINKLVESLAVN